NNNLLAMMERANRCYAPPCKERRPDIIALGDGPELTESLLHDIILLYTINPFCVRHLPRNEARAESRCHRYGHANFWIRLLMGAASLGSAPSATKTLPFPSMPIPCGLVNCPSPLPALPHLVRNAPSFVNFWMRRLLSSST